MQFDLVFWLLAAASAWLVGASKGGLPLVGMLSVPLLALAMSPVVAAGLLLPIFILSDMYGLWLYRKSYQARTVKIIVAAATIGIIGGWLAAAHTDDNLVKLMVGIIGLIYCADALLKVRREIAAKPADLPRGLFWGMLVGYTSFVAHAGAPPYQMYALPQKMDKMTYAGTTTIVFACINALKLPPYWALGQVNVGSLGICALLAPLALFGAWSGHRMTRLLPERLFFRIVEIALFAVSVKLIYDASVAWAAG